LAKALLFVNTARVPYTIQRYYNSPPSGRGRNHSTLRLQPDRARTRQLYHRHGFWDWRPLHYRRLVSGASPRSGY